MNFNYIVDLILNLIFLGYFISVVYFCERLKKTCKCNGMEKYLEDWRFKYMNYANLIFIVLSLLGLIMKMKALCVNGQRGGGQSVFFNYLILTIIIYSLIFVNHYSIFTLINDMIEDDCNCEKELREKIYYFTMGHFSLSVIIFIVIVIGLSELVKIEKDPKEMKKLISKIKDSETRKRFKKLLKK